MLTPLASKEWDYAKAAHLLNRAGFGGSPEQIEALHQVGFDAAIDQMLNGSDDSRQFPKPANVVPVNYREMREKDKTLTDAQRKEKRKEIVKQQRGEMLDLVNWWIDRMAATSNPLREKMTLFWHGHFATSAQKVKLAYFMWQQNDTLRQNALGNFASLTKTVSRDPAMMIYLDTRESQKDHPNENFARELMELFTLGIGNYTEEDIQQAARAFTGYKINPQDQTFRFAPFLHDSGAKTFFGKTGNFYGDDIIDLIVQKPACAEYITKKIWSFYSFENPKPELVAALAESFRSGKYEIKPLMREIFRSEEFYSADALRMQIKSPVQWLVQTSKVLEINPPGGFITVNALRQLGQIPFAPPSVKGWDGGKSWITTSTLLTRYNLSNFILGNSPMDLDRQKKLAVSKTAVKGMPQVMSHQPIDFAKIAPQDLRSDPDKLVATMTHRLFQSQLTARDTKPFVDFLKSKNDTSDQTVRDLLHLMMSTPQFQLT